MGKYPVINLTFQSAKQPLFESAYAMLRQEISEEMSDFIRSLSESALKTNDYLQSAVITGCLCISKESVFTGLNHLNIISWVSCRNTEPEQELSGEIQS